MKRIPWLVLALALALSACGTLNQPEPTATSTSLPTLPPTPSETPTPSPTDTPTPTPTPAYPPEGLGPTNFPAGVNPLTGLEVADATLLDRRPLAVKVANIPRDYRPQWGLSLADMVYEYYTEQGSTRFVALFLGNDAEMVGQIRSARFFDGNVVRMYKSILAFGSGDERVLQRMFNSEYANQLVSEYPAKCPPMCRYEPNSVNYLYTNTAELTKYAKDNGKDNGAQNLDGMFFKLEAPEGGAPAPSLIARFSAAIYNKWDYDEATGKYARSSDVTDDLTGGKAESYAPLTDRLTGDAITADNVVVILVPHEYYSRQPEMIDMQFTGTGTAYVFRDGQGYKVKWARPTTDSVLSLTTEDGQPFPFKPGNTWVEVMGTSSKTSQEGDNWRIQFSIP